MKTFLGSTNEVGKTLKNKRIIPFGAGAWLRAIECAVIEPFRDNIEYVVDNNPTKEAELFGRMVPTYSPEKIEEETEAVVLLTSPIYMYDMYLQLKDMQLGDGIICVAFPLLAIDIPQIEKNEVYYRVTDINRAHRIPKDIHYFWFSGEEKPESYQKCIDTWKAKCPDYKVYEWNQENYDCQKHPFLSKAIELKMWAFATDFARWDMIYEKGGIYLDADVEVIKPFDDLLGNDAFFAYSNISLIDYAVFASKPRNMFIKELLEFYDQIEIPKDRADFKKCFVPPQVKGTFRKKGVVFDGRIQVFGDNMVIFPPTFFIPQDHVVFDPPNITENTYAFHHDNFGWGEGIKVSQSLKIEKNRKLRKAFMGNAIDIGDEGL